MNGDRRPAMKKEDRDLYLSRLNDLARQARTRRCCAASRFLDPARLARAEQHLKTEVEDLSWFALGGYPEAERRVLFLCSAGEQPPADALAGLSAEWSADYHQVRHRDLLGAILGLGLKRDQIGDILVAEGRAQIVLLADIADYVESYLGTAGKASLVVRQIPLSELAAPPVNSKTIRAVVASARLDAVVAAAFDLSRTKASQMIGAGSVAVNHLPVLSPALPVKEGDLMSVRGLGRARLTAMPGQTRKGRRIALLERFL